MDNGNDTAVAVAANDPRPDEPPQATPPAVPQSIGKALAKNDMDVQSESNDESNLSDGLTDEQAKVKYAPWQLEIESFREYERRTTTLLPSERVQTFPTHKYVRKDSKPCTPPGPVSTMQLGPLTATTGAACSHGGQASVHFAGLHPRGAACSGVDALAAAFLPTEAPTTPPGTPTRSHARDRARERTGRLPPGEGVIAVSTEGQMKYVDTIEALLGRPASDARAVHVSVWTVGGDRVQVDCHGTQTVGALRQRVAHELRQGPTGFPKTSQIRLVHGNSIVELSDHALIVDIAPGQPAIDLTYVVLPHVPNMLRRMPPPGGYVNPPPGGWSDADRSSMAAAASR